MRRSQVNTRNLRGRRSIKSSEPQGSDNEDDADNNDEGKDSSSGDEPCTEVRQKRHKRWGGARSFQPLLPSSSADGGCDENEVETTKEMMGVSAGLIGNSDILTWGGGGMRSHTRHGGLSNSAGKSARNNRLSKLMDHLRKLPYKNDKVCVYHIAYLLDFHVSCSNWAYSYCCFLHLSSVEMQPEVLLLIYLVLNRVDSGYVCLSLTGHMCIILKSS